MKAKVLCPALSLAMVLVCCEALKADQAAAKTFVAYSLKAAESRLRAAKPPAGREVGALGHITSITGLVVDEKTGDCILLGQRDASKPELRLEDLVVLLRNVFLYGGAEAPGVTIDFAEGQDVQAVRYFGHVEDTRVGQVFFTADYLMKEFGLGLRAPGVDGMRIYYDMARQEMMSANAGRAEVMSRFWFYPVVARVATVGNGVLLDRCELVVLTETLSARIAGRPVENLRDFCHKPSTEYARDFTAKFDELARAWPVFEELRSLSSLAAVTRGLARTDTAPDIDYWLREYRLPQVKSTREVPVLRRQDGIVGFEVLGGVYLESLSMRLKDGDLSAFTEAVLSARPSADALTWSVVVTPDREIFAPVQAASIDVRSAAEAYARAQYLYQARQYDLAIANWLLVARAYPETGEAYMRVGAAFEKKGMLECAADYYSKALQRDPFLKSISRRKTP